MSGKLKVIFADFLKALHRLWLEMIGGVFLLMGLMFIFAAIQEYRKYVNAPENGTSRFLVVLVSSVVLLFFALESFWKARKSR